MANKDARKKLDDFMEKFNQPNLSRGSTYVDVDGTPQPKYETIEEEKKMTQEEETAALQKEMADALPVDLSDHKFSKEANLGDPKEKDPKKNKLIMKPGHIGGKKKRRRTRKNKRTKKKALKKRHRKSKKARKSKKKRTRRKRR
jgi:hypothetical protein